MAKILDETKRVLEMMSESEEKVSILHEDLIKNRMLCQRINDNLKEVREQRTKNRAELEDNQSLITNLRNCNQYFLSFAQQIYRCNQDFYSNLNALDAEFVRHEELICKNKDIFVEKSRRCEIIATSLTRQVELIDKEEKENIRKNEVEIESLHLENQELESKIEILEQQIKHCENYIKNESTISDHLRNYEEIVQELQELISSKENEINEIKKEVEEAKQFREIMENDEKIKTLEVDNQITEVEIQNKECTSFITDYQQKIDQISEKIEIIEESNKSKEETINTMKSELNIAEIDLKDLEKDYDKTMKCCEKSVLENEERYKQQEDLREKIKLDVDVIKNKIQCQEEYMENLIGFISSNKRIDADLNSELENREEKRKKLKITLQKLEADYAERSLKLEAELQRRQEEIEVTEETNRKLQEDIDSLTLELAQLNDELAHVAIEEKLQEEQMEELDSRVKKLKVEILENKEKILKDKQKTTDCSITVSPFNITPSKAKKVKVRNWDSDSSREGEDRRLSELIKQKMRMKKIGKVNKSVEKEK